MQILYCRGQGGDLEVWSGGKGSTAVLTTCLGDHVEIISALDKSGDLTAGFASGLTENGSVEMILI